jgi:hypothetical protein
LSKYSQVESRFKVFIVRNPMVQSEFNFCTQFMIYRFFKFQTTYMQRWHPFFSFLHAYKRLRWSACTNNSLKSRLISSTRHTSSSDSNNRRDELFFAMVMPRSTRDYAHFLFCLILFDSNGVMTYLHLCRRVKFDMVLNTIVDTNTFSNLQ